MKPVMMQPNQDGINMKAYICPVCKGTGLLSFLVNEEEWHELNFIPIYDFEDCNVCSGMGYIGEGE